MRIKKYAAILICVLLTASLAYAGSIKSANDFNYKNSGSNGNITGHVTVDILAAKGASFVVKKTGTFLKGKVGALLESRKASIVAGKGGSALVRGSTADLAKGTTLPRNLRESLAVQEAMGNPAAGVPAAGQMGEPRWPASEGWVKLQQLLGGGKNPVNVHYLYNPATGAIDDFKIVIPGPRPQ